MDRTDATLTGLWLIWGALLIVVLVVYTLVTPLFDADGTRAAWAWLMPNILPPMALVAGVTYQQGKKDASAGTASAIAGKVVTPVIALAISVFYLLLLSISVIGCYLSAAPLTMLQTSNLWLGPLLAVATAALATRFAR